MFLVMQFCSSLIFACQVRVYTSGAPDSGPLYCCLPTLVEILQMFLSYSDKRTSLFNYSINYHNEKV
jgi:hypothetical protein